MSTVFEQTAGNAVIGMIAVIGILILLALVIWIFGKINVALDRRAQRKHSEAPEEPEESQDPEEEIAAVIAAAIAAACAEDGTDAVQGGYRVSSVRRVRKIFA